MKKKVTQYILQHGKVIFSSDDGVSIPILWNNITGRNFVGKDITGASLKDQYVPYLENMKRTAGLPSGYIQYFKKAGHMSEEFMVPDSMNMETRKIETENGGTSILFREATKFSDIFIADEKGPHGYGLPGKFSLTEEALKQVRSWHCVQWGHSYHFNTHDDKDGFYRIYLKADQIIASTLFAIVEIGSVPVEKEEEENTEDEVITAPVVEMQTTEPLAAMDVFKQCTLENGVVRLPNIKLDAKVYNDVKTILTKNGGQWKGGKTQGFIFGFDPTNIFLQLQEGEKVNNKKKYQFFATPRKLSEQLVELAQLKNTDRILEPSAGQGDIINVIEMETGATVECFELMPENVSILKKRTAAILLGDDFLKSNAKNCFDKIIANPPFTKNQDIDHVKHMYTHLKKGGRLVSIMSTSWGNGTQKKQIEFRDWLREVGAIITDVEAGMFKESGTNIATVIVVIDKV